MASKVLWCLLITVSAGRAVTDGRGLSSSERILSQLRTQVYRLSTDLASVMEDTKVMTSCVETLRSFGEQHECKKEEPVNPSCEGIEEGLTSLQVGVNPITAPCDGHGWIVFLRRIDNKNDFPGRNWDDYKYGFGNPRGSFWQGLEQIHLLTNPKPAVLRVELQAWDGEVRFAQYSFFRVASERHGYRLFIDGYTGNAGDSLNYHNGMKFSTKDRDNDDDSRNCAGVHGGGWWYKYCFNALLTSEYIEDGVDVPDWDGLIWKHWKGKNYSYKRAELKLRLD